MALLFSQCVDLVREHPNWNSQAHMKTLKLEAKDDQIVAHLPPLTQYLKETYLESDDRSGMDITCAELLADYNMMNPTKKIPTKAKLGVEMKKMSELLRAKDAPLPVPAAAAAAAAAPFPPPLPPPPPPPPPPQPAPCLDIPFSQIDTTPP